MPAHQFAQSDRRGFASGNDFSFRIARRWNSRDDRFLEQSWGRFPATSFPRIQKERGKLELGSPTSLAECALEVQVLQRVCN
jgi:hypothetical protein